MLTILRFSSLPFRFCHGTLKNCFTIFTLRRWRKNELLAQFCVLAMDGSFSVSEQTEIFPLLLCSNAVVNKIEE